MKKEGLFRPRFLVLVLFSLCFLKHQQHCSSQQPAALRQTVAIIFLSSF